MKPLPCHDRWMNGGFRKLLIVGLLCLRANAEFAPPAIPKPEFPNRMWEVRDCGATGDGKTLDTAAINSAIDKCHAAGGGSIHFSRGKYLAASIHLKSNVCFRLDAEAAIVGARQGYDAPEPNPQFGQFQDFGHSHFHNAVMWGEDLDNFAIIGGKVNGGGVTQGDAAAPDAGDKVIAIRGGKNLLFQELTHDSGGHFVYLLNNCDNVTLERVTIKRTRDALDLMGCRNVAVCGCNFTGCVDDTLGIKSDYALGKKLVTENIFAWDNYFESGCNALQFGSETAGDFRHVWIWNIKVGRALKAGIGITSNDGALIEDVHYRNITMKNVANPIFMVVTRRLRTGEPGAKVGVIRNVYIADVTCTEVIAGTYHGPANAATISGLPESAIENITLENVKITYKGAEDPQEASARPKYSNGYAPNAMGIRPASGLFARQVHGLTLKNCQIDYEKPTVKPVLVFQNVRELALERCKIPNPERTDAIRFDDVEGVAIRECPGLEYNAAPSKR